MDKKTLEYIVRLKDQASAGFKKIGTTGQRAFEGMRNYAKDLGRQLFDLRGIIMGLAGAWGMQALLRRAIDIGKQFVQTAAQMEVFETQLTTVLGSTRAAEQAIRDLTAFAAKTPFEIPQLVETRIQLESVGIAGMDVIKTVGDTAAAMGKDINDTARALISMEREVLRRYGIEVATEGNKATFEWRKKTGEMVQTTVEGSKAIHRQTLLAIWNENYAGGMERFSKTWAGMMSNLRDLWTQFQQTIMESGPFDTLKILLKGVLDTTTQWHGALKDSNEEMRLLGIRTAEYTIAVLQVLKVIDIFINKLREIWKYAKYIGAAHILVIQGLQTLREWLGFVKEEIEAMGPPSNTFYDMTIANLKEWIFEQKNVTAKIDETNQTINNMGDVVEEVNKALDWTNLSIREQQKYWMFLHESQILTLDEAITYQRNLADAMEQIDEMTDRAALGVRYNLAGSFKGAQSQIEQTTTAVDFFGTAIAGAMGIARTEAQKLLGVLQAIINAIKAAKIGEGGWGIASALVGGLFGLIGAQQGYYGKVEQPTLFLTHPGEHVAITPAAQSTPAMQEVTVVVHRAAPDTYIEKIIRNPRTRQRLYQGWKWENNLQGRR